MTAWPPQDELAYLGSDDLIASVLAATRRLWITRPVPGVTAEDVAFDVLSDLTIDVWPLKSPYFATFATEFDFRKELLRRIYNQIRKSFRASQREKKLAQERLPRTPVRDPYLDALGDELLTGLLELPQKLREVAWSLAVEGKTYTATAEELKLSPKQVRRLWEDAVTRLGSKYN